MMNTISMIIFKLAAAVPLLLIFSAVYYLKTQKLIILLSFLGVIALICIFSIIAFSYGKRHLSPIQIRVSEITHNNKLKKDYVVTYIIPIITAFLDNTYLVKIVVIFVILLFIICFMNDKSSPNILLLFGGYHFYQVSTENGISNYLLLSKRILRNKQDVKVVGQMFEYLLLDRDE